MASAPAATRWSATTPIYVPTTAATLLVVASTPTTVIPVTTGTAARRRTSVRVASVLAATCWSATTRTSVPTTPVTLPWAVSTPITAIPATTETAARRQMSARVANASAGIHSTATTPIYVPTTAATLLAAASTPTTVIPVTTGTAARRRTSVRVASVLAATCWSATTRRLY